MLYSKAMYIKDVFYSYQGEGPWVGYPQLFIRFWGCNIHCAYCDEPDFREDREQHTELLLRQRIAPFLKKPIHSISITGGEPLVQPEAIEAIAKMTDLPLYLESNATLPPQLDRVKDCFTYFSMDYKPGYEETFEASLKIIKDKPNVFVKLVLLRDFKDSEIEFVSNTINKVNPDIPLVIQPVTPFADITVPPTEDDIHRAYLGAKALIPDVRIIPQTHKMIGLK